MNARAGPFNGRVADFPHSLCITNEQPLFRAICVIDVVAKSVMAFSAFKMVFEPLILSAAIVLCSRNF